MNQNRKNLGILLIYSLVVFFIGNQLLPITDPVESNYVETAKEMILTGNYFSPVIYGNYWYDKPILFYLELIAAFQWFGFTDFAARFFPAVFSTIGLFLTYGFAACLAGRRQGLAAALILGTSLEYWYIGHAVITDMTLFVTISGTLIAFYLGWSRNRPLYYYLAFAAAALAVLTKGPIGLCLPGLIILLFLLVQRSLRSLLSWHILLGFLLFVSVCAVWYYPMYRMHGMDFIDTFFGVHNALRATVPEHPRDDVCFFYLIIFFAGFFPWSLLGLPAAIRRLVHRQVSLPSAPADRFLAIWAATVFLCFQCFATKYVTYTMPYMMPLAIWMARYFSQNVRIFRTATAAMAVVYLLLDTMVAPAIMNQHSGRELAMYLQHVVPAGSQAQILSYQVPYPASLVYYSGLDVRRLEKAEDIAREKPNGMTWTSTNVMPFQAMEEIADDRPAFLLTSPEHREDVLQVPGNWRQIGQVGDWLIFERQ